MNINIPSLLLGVAAVGALYFLFLVATKGLPAAWAWIKAWVSEADAALVAKVQALESTVVADLKKDVDALKADVAAIKTKVGV